MNDSHLPLHKTVVVALGQSAAFSRFTDGIGTWWPLQTHSIGQERAVSVDFGSSVGEPIVETLDDGSTEIWGTILNWNPPESVRFTWHPGAEPDDRQHVTVAFTPVEGGTRVDLTHVGWEVYADKASETRAGYDSGWEGVLALFVKIV